MPGLVGLQALLTVQAADKAGKSLWRALAGLPQGAPPIRRAATGRTVLALRVVMLHPVRLAARIQTIHPLRRQVLHLGQVAVVVKTHPALTVPMAAPVAYPSLTHRGTNG